MYIYLFDNYKKCFIYRIHENNYLAYVNYLAYAFDNVINFLFVPMHLHCHFFVTYMHCPLTPLLLIT